MPQATRIDAEVGALKESIPGTAASGQYRALRFVSVVSLGLYKETYDSEEVLVSRMLSDSRHGVRVPQGEIESYLCAGAYDDFWLSVLGQSVWTVSSAAATVSVTVSGGRTLTRLSGNFHTDGFFPGDRLLASGLDAEVRLLSILAISEDGLSLTVDDPVEDGTYSGFSASVHSRRAAVGNEAVTFTLERAFRNLGLYQHFLGSRVASVTVDVPASGLSRASWQVAASTASRFLEASASGESTYRASEESRPFSGRFASVWAVSDTGEAVPLLATSLSFVIDNDLGATAVVGSNSLSELSWGTRLTANGQMTILLEPLVSGLFDEERELAIYIRLSQISRDSREYLSFYFPRCRVSPLTIGEGGESSEAVLASFDFVSLAVPAPLSQVVVASGPPGEYDGVDGGDPVVSLARLLTETGYIIRTEDGYELLREFS